MVKICGLRHAQNLLEISQSPGLDWVGFIFYGRSPRCAEPVLDASFAQKFPLRKAGVFVNESPDVMVEKAARFGLDALQLHGSESPEICREMRRRLPGTEIWKAFSVGEDFDFQQVAFYEGDCDKFLFDAKGPAPGGNGTAFDWRLLENYRGATPFWLSGGIGPEHAEILRNYRHPRLGGLDLNSRFELEPGLKNVAMLRVFLTQLGGQAHPTQTIDNQ